MAWPKGTSGNPLGRPHQALAAYAKQFTPEAIEGIVQIARNRKNSSGVRLQAWNDILDRGWGKPTQTVAGDPDNPLQSVTEVRLVIVDGKASKVIEHEDVVSVPMIEAAE